MANKNKRCCHCKEYFEESSMQKLPVGWFCSQDHIMEYAINKSTKATKTKERIQYREDREKLKTRSDYAKEAQAAVNKYIRARDKGKPCISCGKPDNGLHQRHAGHYKSRGAHPELALNVLNNFGQCATCNVYLSGNLIEYRKGFIERYGVELVERIETHNSLKNYTKADFQRFKKIFNRRARFYEKIKLK